MKIISNLPKTTIKLWEKLQQLSNNKDRLQNKSSGDLADRLCVSPNTLSVKLQQLCDADLIKIEGNRQRYKIKLLAKTQQAKTSRVSKTQQGKTYRVKSKKIKNSKDEISMNDIPPPEGGRVNGIKKEKNNKNKKSGKKSPRKRVNQNFQKMAEYLIHVVQKLDGYRYGKHLTKFEESFRLLHEEDGVPVKIIWETLRWYYDNRDSGKYRLPKCCTANMFRGSFPWIAEKFEEHCEPDPSLIDDRWWVLSKKLLNNSRLGETRVDPSRLALLLQEVDNWQQGVLEIIRDLVSRQMCGNVEMGVVDGVRPSVLDLVIDTTPDGTNLAILLGEYLEKWAASFGKWNGDLQRFSPMNPNFVDFLNYRCKDLDGGWLWKTELDLFRSIVDKS